MRDDAEVAAGNDQLVAEADTDGLLSGAEVEAGTDPLRGVSYVEVRSLRTSAYRDAPTNPRRLDNRRGWGRRPARDPQGHI